MLLVKINKNAKKKWRCREEGEHVKQHGEEKVTEGRGREVGDKDMVGDEWSGGEVQ